MWVCTVEGCPANPSKRNNIERHVWLQHVRKWNYGDRPEPYSVTEHKRLVEPHIRRARGPEAGSNTSPMTPPFTPPGSPSVSAMKVCFPPLFSALGSLVMVGGCSFCWYSTTRSHPHRTRPVLFTLRNTLVLGILQQALKTRVTSGTPLNMKRVEDAHDAAAFALGLGVPVKQDSHVGPMRVATPLSMHTPQPTPHGSPLTAKVRTTKPPALHFPALCLRVFWPWHSSHSMLADRAWTRHIALLLHALVTFLWYPQFAFFFLASRSCTPH